MDLFWKGSHQIDRYEKIYEMEIIYGNELNLY